MDWFTQITMALEYVHQHNILHRDLKTQNIFMTKNNYVKLGLPAASVLSFSIHFRRLWHRPCPVGVGGHGDHSRGHALLHVARTLSGHTVRGSPYGVPPPQIFSHYSYSYKSDVWALGCVLYEMTMLSHPFEAQVDVRCRLCWLVRAIAVSAYSSAHRTPQLKKAPGKGARPLSRLLLRLLDYAALIYLLHFAE